MRKKEARGGGPLGAPPGFGPVPGGGLNSVFVEPGGYPRVNVDSPCGARGGEPGGVAPGASRAAASFFTGARGFRGREAPEIFLFQGVLFLVFSLYFPSTLTPRPPLEHP